MKHFDDFTAQVQADELTAGAPVSFIFEPIPVFPFPEAETKTLRQALDLGAEAVDSDSFKKAVERIAKSNAYYKAGNLLLRPQGKYVAIEDEEGRVLGSLYPDREEVVILPF